MADAASRVGAWKVAGAAAVTIGVLTSCSAGGPPEPHSVPHSDASPVTVPPESPPEPPQTSADETTAADSDDSQHTDTPADEPEVVPGLAPVVAPEDIRAGEELDVLAEPLIDVQAEILAKPGEADLDHVVTVADGPAKEQLLAAMAEFEDNGWRQDGTPTVVSTAVESVDLENDPPTLVLRVCLDHSDVDIVDTDGISMVDPTAQRQVLNIFTMHYVDERWVLHDQSFPADVAC